jgi:adenylosuccinate synthase
MGAEVWVVLRTHPIRIAGDSGPLESETSWEKLGLEPEYTTVTKKIRRVGGWNPEWAIKSVEANRAPGRNPKIALTFADYWWPGLAGLGNNGRKAVVADTDLLLDVREKVESISNLVGAPVAMLGTGPDTQMLLEGWDT